MGAPHGIKKKVMATKKDIQKNDRKGTGAGLAAGMESENKAPKTEKQKYEEYPLVELK